MLHGRHATDNTLLAPPVAQAARRWITRYLNDRYFHIPPNITISCREGNLLVGGPPDEIGGRRTVLGQGEYLRRYAKSNGSIALDGGTAHWWIIGEHDEEKTDQAERRGIVAGSDPDRRSFSARKATTVHCQAGTSSVATDGRSCGLIGISSADEVDADIH